MSHDLEARVNRTQGVRRGNDDGAALILVLVLMVVGSLIVTGLLRYTQAILDTRPALHEQNASAEAVKSVTRMAITLQRDLGPTDCFTTTSNYTMNGVNVVASCSTISSYTTGRGRIGAVSTVTNGTTANITTPSWAGPTTTAIAGGTLFDSTAATWASHVGDNPNGTAWSYPPLPQIPSFERPGSQASIGSCYLYYPGRYPGTTPLTLSGGTHYFASGVYYFERPLVITNGAQVVFGEGLHAGCAVDAQAAYASTAPRSHEITGKGATLLLGDIAYVSVQESSVRINRRVSTASTRGSEGIAIRTVNFGQANSTVTVPADLVLLADGTTQPVASHSVTPVANATPVFYRTSSLAPASAYALDIRLNGTSVTTNRFVADGYVFTPNAAVRVTSTVSSYALAMANGVVSTRLELGLASAPSIASNYAVGVMATTIQRKVKLRVTAQSVDHTATSTAILEVHADKSYAINSWVVDP